MSLNYPKLWHMSGWNEENVFLAEHQYSSFEKYLGGPYELA